MRRICADDFEFFASIHADATVAQYLGNGRPRSQEDSRIWFDELIESYARTGLGQLAVLRRSDGELLGRCGLSGLAVEVGAATGAPRRAWYIRSQIPPDARVNSEPELGYTFARSAWGNGYATEAARGILDCAREQLNISEVVSLIHPDNSRSLRVSDRFGAKLDGSLELAGRLFNRFVVPTAT